MCRYPACRNFGLHYNGAALAVKKSVSDNRNRIEVESGKFTCQWCGLSSILKPTQAIRPLARYYLKLSLPFADCPNTDCKNYGINRSRRVCLR